MKNIRISHQESGIVLAEGPIGWGITPFEGNYYIQGKYLKTDRLKANFIPGFCIYKFLFVWLDLHVDDSQRIYNIGWRYWLPNPLLPFIWFRVALPRRHPEIRIDEL